MGENKNNLMPKDHVSIMLEKIDGKFDLLAEDISGVKEKLSGLSDKVDGLSDKVDLLVEDMDYVKGKLVSIDDKLDKKAEKSVVDNHETRLGKLEKVAVAS